MKMITMLAFLTTVTACALTPPYPVPPVIPPQQETVQLSMSPATAYRHAYTTFAKMPTAVVTSSSDATLTFGGQLHNAVYLGVVVEPAPGQQATVTISGSVLPNKMVTGTFTEVSDYARLLREGR